MGSFRIWIAAILWIGTPAAGNAASVPIPLKPEAIRAEIERTGAGPTLQSLFEDDKRWPKVVGLIGSGSPAWLKIAVALEPASDGASAEDLRDAVFIALKPSPRLVLALINDNKFADACEPGLVDYSNREIRRMIGDRIRVVEAVSDPGLQTARNGCLQRMRRVLAEMRRHPRS